MLSSMEILVLSAIQGVSEFVPVSSAAHLLLITKYYAFVNKNLLIDICLHLGSLLAIILYFRKDLFNLVNNKLFLKKIFIGTIPIIPVGYILFQTGIIDQIRSLEIIAWMSLIFGLLLYISDKSKITNKIDSSFTNKSAIFIDHNIIHVYGAADRFIILDRGEVVGEFNKEEITKEELVQKMIQLHESGKIKVEA